MSRIGKSVIEVPANVNVTINGKDVKIKGPKGELSLTLLAGIHVKQIDKKLFVEREGDTKFLSALHGLFRMKIFNMVTGVLTGYEKNLEIIGVGYRAQKKGKDLELSLGYSHPVIFPCEEGIEFVLDGQTKVSVKGISKERVGQVAANLKRLRSVEPYKGKGIRYTGEFVRKKAGKAGKVGGKK